MVALVRASLTLVEIPHCNQLPDKTERSEISIIVDP